jgi:3-oxoacyl-[acyl-carrier protein] reductase
MKPMKQTFTIGSIYRTRLNVDSALVKRFAEVSGDENPIHMDAEDAKAYGYPRQVAHGALMLAAVSKMIGMEVPGPGAVWMNQSIEWTAPVFVGDQIEITATIAAVSDGASVLRLDLEARNQRDELTMRGNAQVKVSEKVSGTASSESDDDRVVLVTGGSRGIGAAIAQRLGSCGMSIALNYHSAKKAAEDVVNQVQGAGGTARAFAADLNDPNATKTMVNDVIGVYGRLDIVVHCAVPGINPRNVSELHYSDMEDQLKLTLGGAISIVSATQRGMAERGFGRFIFLGTSAMNGTPPVGWAAYLTAKQALWGLVKSMATEFGPSGITTNMVSPGLTVTDLTTDIPVRAKEVEAHRSPMRRLATSQDTAELVSFLAGNASSYINGANLPVSGGPQ